MKTFSFPHIQEILNFQFLTDSSGIILDTNGQLYRFRGNHTVKLQTPENFKISQFHFINEEYGAIIGNGGVLEKEIQESSMGGSYGFILLFLFLLLLGRKFKKAGNQVAAFSLFLIAGAGFFISCSNNWQAYKTQAPDSKYTTIITSNQLFSSSAPHIYIANKGQKSFIAITENKGKDWTTHQVPTNFNLTALTAIGRNFLVGTFANESTSKDRPFHGDGDLYIYGTDTTFNRRLAGNTPEKPFAISVNRGVKGIKYNPADSVLFVFGSETEPVWPKNEVSTTEGNVYQLQASLKPDYKIIAVPDTLNVLSLSKSKSGDIWVTLNNKKPRTTKGYINFVSVDSKKLLRLKDGDWQEVTIPPLKSYEQVEFIPGTDTGYVLAASGEVMETKDGGNAWDTTQFTGIEKIRLFYNKLTLQKNLNELILYQPSLN